MAARGAFASVIPGSNNRVGVMPAMGAGVWGLSLLWAGVLDLQASVTLGVTSQSDWPCVASMTVGGLVVGAPLVWMLRRRAPLTPGLTAFLAALAALSVANRGVPDAPSCVRTDGPPVAWKHDRRGRNAVRPDRPSLVALARYNDAVRTRLAFGRAAPNEGMSWSVP
jgi:hypothetical protein